MKKKKAELSPIQAELRRILAGPTASECLERIRDYPALSKEYDSAVALVNRKLGKDLRTCIALGTIGHLIRTDACRRSRSSSTLEGDKAIQLVARALGMHGHAFWRAIDVVETFTADEITSFLTRKCAAGFLITPGHVCQIAQMSAHQRHELIECYYRHSLTLQELFDEIDLPLNPPRRSSARPRTMPAAIAQASNMANRFRERLECSPHEVLYLKLRELIDGERDPGPDELRRLTALIENLQALQVGITRACATIKEAITVLRERPVSSS
jgi:hypothetical protein